MPTSDKPKQWDVVVVPFPYADQRAEKRRPALVVSNDAFNAQTGLLWVVMITTSRETWHGDVTIDDYRKAGLPAPSKVRTAKIATIEASRVLRVAGRFSATQSQKISRTITSNWTG